MKELTVHRDGEQRPRVGAAVTVSLVPEVRGGPFVF